MRFLSVMLLFCAAPLGVSAQDRPSSSGEVLAYTCIKDGVRHYSSSPIQGSDCRVLHRLPPPTAGASVTVSEILSVAKMTGACGILQAMSAFQANTQLAGGDEFLVRFWSTEAARLGKTPEQYIKDCQSSIDAYDMLWKRADQAEG